MSEVNDRYGRGNDPEQVHLFSHNGRTEPRQQKVIEFGRFQAAMVGSAVGDALGWPTEFARSTSHRVGGEELPLRRFVDWQKLVGGRWWGYPETIRAGEYSDDTQLTLAVARCINDFGVFEPERFAFSELPLWLHYERGGGRSIKTAAHALVRKNASWLHNFYRNKDVTYGEAGANGAAMRTLPLALVNADDEDAFVRDATYNAVITHGHPRAIVGALTFGHALRVGLRTDEPVTAVEEVEEWLRVRKLMRLFEDPELERWARDWDQSFGSGHSIRERMLKAIDEMATFIASARRSTDGATFYRSIGALDPATRGSGTVTAAAAIWNYLHHVSEPSEAIIDAVNALGSDTDTIASLTGALVGATFGPSALPDDLGSLVQDLPYIHAVAERLHRIAFDDPGSVVSQSRRLERREAYLQILAWEMGLHDMFWDAIGEGGTISHPALGRGVIEKKEIRTLRRSDYIAKLIRIVFDSGQTCVFHSRIENGARLSESLADEVQRALA